MRNAIRLMRLATGWAIAASMVVSNSSGMVLCIGEDGHLAVEPVHENHADHCEGSDHGMHDATFYLVSIPDEHDCIDCFDVMLDLDMLSQNRNETRHDLLPRDTLSKNFSDIFTSGLMPDHEGILCLSNRAPPCLSQNILTQRTVVLRL